MVELNRQKCFSLEEANELLPIISRITRGYVENVEQLIHRIEAIGEQSPQAAETLEEQVTQLVTEWQTKIEKLGGRPKGLWVADFDSGDGYFCWKFPEPEIGFWHRYSDGFSGRIPIHKYLASKRVQSVPSLDPSTKPIPEL